MIRLSASTLKQFRADLAGRVKEDTPGMPFWTDRLSMALNHIEVIENENAKLKEEMQRLVLADEVSNA